MVSTSRSNSRALSLRAPIANEEERARFQRRLSLAAFVTFGLSALFYVVSAIAVAVMSPGMFWHVQASRPSLVHLAASALALVAWLYLRRGHRERATLDLLDAALAISLSAGWTLMVVGWMELEDRPESVALLACTYTLVVRAALLPSTPARTGVITAVSLAPLLPVTSAMYAGRPLGPHQPLSPEVYVGIWSALCVATAVVISYVIYGLQMQVRKAMQLGQYLLEEKIGEGGMGTVYRARHALLRRPTAIKLLSVANAHAIERFEREVQITAGLTHPNTVAVFDYGRTPDGVFYYAMEYLEGISLEDLVVDHGPQPIRRVVHVLLQMCGALEEAHAAGLVHRDIKPANIMLTERGGLQDVAKVLDFGLVKEAEGAADMAVDPKMSAANVILGTPHYMAPEAIQDPSKVDARTDLYAVGATAYFLLTGERVFDGTSLIEICSKHLHEAAPPPSAKREEVPAALDEVILACLAKNPEDRPADAADLAARLGACEVAEWTRDDARGWWEGATRRRDGVAGHKESGERGRRALESAQTVAVDLDDRAAS